MPDEILVAKVSGAVTNDAGETVPVVAGVTHIRKGKSSIRHVEADMFEPIRTVYDEVEQATAAPGETRKRGPGRPRKAA